MGARADALVVVSAALVVVNAAFMHANQIDD
jgi:hypothetical protein